jgi:hypothetical protein
MKSILISILIVFVAGCNSTNRGGGPGLSMQGTWTVMGNVAPQRGPAPQSGTGSYQVELVPSPCSVTTPVGTFSIQGPICFIANNNTGQGSISGPGISPKSTGQGVLIGVPANPLPPGMSFNLLFIAADQSLNFVEFVGGGTSANGTISGAGGCSPSTPICQGESATFSATLQ